MTFTPPKSITLGNQLFDSCLIAGPLAGFTCAPMRRLVWGYSNPAFCYTEMISAQHLMGGGHMPTRFLYRAPEEKKLCWQLSGTDPVILGEAAAKAVELGADLIDLNCGCPKAKIRSKRAGSYHLEDPDRLFKIVSSMRQAITKPLLVKIRLHPSREQQVHHAVIEAVQAAGADGIVIHGRTYEDDYDRAIDLAALAQCVDYAAIPVLINGDVFDPQSAQHILQQTNGAGLVIARAMMGKPWLIQQIESAWAGQMFNVPTLQQRGALLLEHIEDLIFLEGEMRAMLQARKITKYYARDIWSDAAAQQAYQFSTLHDLKQWLTCWMDWS
jgi:nifR3 family TIM-barrel protein